MPDIAREHRLKMEPELEKQIESIQKIRVEFLKVMKRILENNAPVDRNNVITTLTLLFDTLDRCENAMKGELRALVIIENATYVIDHLANLSGVDTDYIKSIRIPAEMKDEWFENA